MIRVWIVLFMLALAGSGLTAIPLEWELRIASDVLHCSFVPDLLPDLVA